MSRPVDGHLSMSVEAWPLPDGPSVTVLRHRPPREPEGPAVLYLHGIQSHPGWFIGSAQALARAGSEVFQVTRRGSGTAEAGRGDAAGPAQLLADVDSAAEAVLTATGAEKLAVVGVSWGGKLAATWALRTPLPVASLTLVAPGIVPRVDVGLAVKAAIGLCRLVAPRRRFAIPLSRVELFTANPAMRDYLRADPHRLHRATARFLVASALLDRRLRRAPRGALTMPVTLMLATRDRIIDNAATREAVDRLTGGSAHVVELDADHTIEFEPRPEEFFRLLCRAVGAREVTGD